MNKPITTQIPNDLIDKYLPLFSLKEQFEAVLDLIRQSYAKGYEDGSTEEYDRIMKG